jgi:hypothetical protein
MILNSRASYMYIRTRPRFISQATVTVIQASLAASVIVVKSWLLYFHVDQYSDRCIKFGRSSRCVV